MAKSKAAKAFKQSEAEFARYMRLDLGPDLRKFWKMPQTAKDAVKCGRLIGRGVSDPSYARWLRRDLIPALRDMKLNMTADDFARCAHILGR